MTAKKGLVLFFFIVLFIASFYLNVFIMKAKKLPKLEYLNLKGVYLDLSLIEDKDQSKKIKDFINSGNDAHFGSLVFQTQDPIGQFYGFCGYLNCEPKKAVGCLEKLLISSKKVNIYISENNTKTGYPLGYAILILIRTLPKDLISSDENIIYKNIDSALAGAYRSALTKTNNEYKKELTELITEKKPDLLNNLNNAVIKESGINKPISEMSDKEKNEATFLLHTLSDDERTDAIKTFLNDSNETLVKNTINAINENDSKETASLLAELFNKKRTAEIAKLAIEKYALILKEKSLTQISNLLKTETNNDIVKTGLEQINKYGDDSNYDFLKIFLDTKYPGTVNQAALEAIVKTTYKTRPVDVINTMVFLLRKGDEALSSEAIRFYMDNNIQDSVGAVITRLKLRESEKMERTALLFIEKFKPLGYSSLLKELISSGKTEEIKMKASELAGKIGIKEAE